MRINIEDLTAFQEICRKICLNIPGSYVWKWDDKRQMAVVVLEGSDAEMVFFPLFKEFSQHWNFTSASTSRESISKFISSEYGVLPGQVFFTSNPLNNLILFVAWWPWGNEGNVSMRVGLIPWNNFRLQDGFAYHCLKKWLAVADGEAGLYDTLSSTASTSQ